MQLKPEQIISELNKYGNASAIIQTYEIKGIAIQLLREVSPNGACKYRGTIIGTNDETSGLLLKIHYTFEVYPNNCVRYEITEADGRYAGRFYNMSARKHIRETCRALAKIHNVPNIDRLH